MTVAAMVPINTYVGTGGTGTYAFTFPIFLSSQILVTVTSPTGTLYTLQLGIDYNVTGLNASGDPSSTGSIVLINASQAWMTGGNLTTNYTLTIQSNFTYAQTTSIRNQGDFYRSALENALDTLEYQIQQLAAAVAILQVGGTIIQPSTILTDQATGKTYQLIINNGIFGTLEIT